MKFKDYMEKEINYPELIRQTIDMHIKKAAEYEAAGRIKDTRYLRAVANMLGVMLQGDLPHTVLP